MTIFLFGLELWFKTRERFDIQRLVVGGQNPIGGVCFGGPLVLSTQTHHHTLHAFQEWLLGGRHSTGDPKIPNALVCGFLSGMVCSCNWNELMPQNPPQPAAACLMPSGEAALAGRAS